MAPGRPRRKSTLKSNKMHKKNRLFTLFAISENTALGARTRRSRQCADEERLQGENINKTPQLQDFFQLVTEKFKQLFIP